jgi:hypothetical protein
MPQSTSLTIQAKARLPSRSGDPRTTIEIALSIIVVVFLMVGHITGTVLADRDFDSLLSKALAEGSALNDTGELLGRVDGEGVGETTRQHGCLFVVADDAVIVDSATDVEDHELESVVVSVDQELTEPTCLPESSLSAYGEILKDEPEAGLAFRIVQLEGIDGRLAYKIPRVV